MKVKAFGRTDKGYVRSNNEDGFFVDEELGVYAVADGMGGHRAGEVASTVTLEALRDTVHRDKGNPPVATLERAMQTAGLHIFNQVEKAPDLRGMGTTLTGLLIVPGDTAQGNLVHVGDSRCYRFRDNKLEQLTEDHSWVWEQQKAGLLSATEAGQHPMRNVITRSVGHGGESNPDLIAVDLAPGDLYMLCSDGLCGFVGDDEIEAIIRDCPTDPEKLTERLVNCALEHGGEDNVTVVCLRLE